MDECIDIINPFASIALQNISNSSSKNILLLIIMMLTTLMYNTQEQAKQATTNASQSGAQIKSTNSYVRGTWSERSQAKLTDDDDPNNDTIE